MPDRVVGARRESLLSSEKKRIERGTHPVEALVTPTVLDTGKHSERG